MTEHDELLRMIAERVALESEAGGAPPCATAEQIEEAEANLGFSLPPLLARLYHEVGNGGFGPEYRLLPLAAPVRRPGKDGAGVRTAVSEYRAEYAPGRWPAGVLPILEWGCGMYAAIDCTDAQAPVLLFEPNAVAADDDWSAAWFLDADSLAGWLGAWLAGSGWYEEEVMTGATPREPEPWPQAAHRLRERPAPRA